MTHLAESAHAGRRMARLPVEQRNKALAMAAGAIAATAVLCILAAHYDRSWFPPDEGAYAHVAQQMLRGRVLHLELQDIHAGYVNFANAGALWLFGDNLLSLRYPLVAMGLVQALLAFLLFRDRGPWTAAVSAVALTALTTINFVNPTAHWYALCLTVATIYAAWRLPREARGRLELLGFLIVLLFLFRQLTGVLVAMGLVAWLLYDAPRRPGGTPRLARGLVAILALGLVGYLLMTRQPTNLVLFAFPALAVLAALFGRVAMDDRAVLAMAGRLMLGGLAAALPLFVYFAAHGALVPWFDDAVMASVSQTRLKFIGHWYHLLILVEAAKGIARLESPAVVLNGLLWIGALSLPMVNGVLLARAIRRGDAVARHPLPFVAIFYALVAVHHQIPIYLWFAMGPMVLGFLWLSGARDGWRSSAPALGVLAMALVALGWQAAQPPSRNMLEIVRGDTPGMAPVAGPRRASLRIEPVEAEQYRALLGLIERESRPDQTILALPNNPELYYLSGRASAVRFFNSAFGLRSADDVAALIRQFDSRPPALVFHDPRDKYNTPESDAVIGYIRQRYESLGRLGVLDVYRLAQP